MIGGSALTMYSRSLMPSWRTSSLRRKCEKADPAPSRKDRTAARLKFSHDSPFLLKTSNCPLKKMQQSAYKRPFVPFFSAKFIRDCSQINSWRITMSKIVCRPCVLSIGSWSRRMQGCNSKLISVMSSLGSGFREKLMQPLKSKEHLKGTGDLS
jgi:hypothetical protein